jgi:hypothetical protein
MVKSYVFLWYSTIIYIYIYIYILFYHSIYCIHLIYNLTCLPAFTTSTQSTTIQFTCLSPFQEKTSLSSFYYTALIKSIYKHNSILPWSSFLLYHFPPLIFSPKSQPFKLNPTFYPSQEVLSQLSASLFVLLATTFTLNLLPKILLHVQP